MVAGLPPPYPAAFQFHKGTIRTLQMNLGVGEYKEFQFHKGTIRTGEPTTGSMPIIDFNSIKVRLELTGLDLRRYVEYSFQFHKGTIRTVQTANQLATYPDFNSIKVRLERKEDDTVYQQHDDFNSIKVRLEPGHGCGREPPQLYFNSIKVRLERWAVCAIGGRVPFQFHKGTIRTSKSKNEMQ